MYGLSTWQAVYLNNNSLQAKGKTMEKYLDNFKECIQKEAPFCQDKCPFTFDIFDFIEKIKQGNFNSAYKIYRNSVGFPEVASNLCTETCKNVCPLGSPINLKKLEKAAVEYATRKTPTDYNLPTKKEKIAIIGGGISGLACLLKLATKKYPVDLYEKSNSLGGTLQDLPTFLQMEEDINLQLTHEEFNVIYNTEITSLDQLSGYSAIYVATGENGSTLGLSTINGLLDPIYIESENLGIFFGGQLFSVDKTKSLAIGLETGIAIDNFIKTKNINYGHGHRDSKVQIENNLIHNLPEVNPSSPLTKEDAILEASRCIKCQCNPCQLYCDLASYSNKWPLRMRDEIQATTLPGTSEVKSTPAKRLISTCTQCGLCKDTCPKDIDLGGLILEARKSMHNQGKMPWVFNEFWLKDMAFSNKVANLAKGSPKTHNSNSLEIADASIQSPKLMFFPGCQLSASEPTLVEKAYALLLKKQPNTGIYLSCCGVPASWAGQDDLRDESILEIKNTWEQNGKPTFILACSSCKKFFSEFLPEIETTYIYFYLEASDFSESKAFVENSTSFSVFHPCTTRKDDSVRTKISKTLEAFQVNLIDSSYHDTYTGCCGYGGQSHIADPSFVDSVKTRRLEESSAPFITYCINCRDAFKKDRPGTVHLLDLLFNHTPTDPTLTERRLNRLGLKQNLLKKYWEEEMAIENHKLLKKIKISDGLKLKLSENRILEEEVAQVIEFLERSKRVIYDEDSETLSGYMKIGMATYWVEYKVDGDFYILVDSYTHRISIELEEVWNGEKRINEEML